MGGPKNLAFAESEIKKCIIETDGVSSIIAFSMAFSSGTRRLTVSATVLSVDGDALQINQVIPS